MGIASQKQRQGQILRTVCGSALSVVAQQRKEQEEQKGISSESTNQGWHLWRSTPVTGHAPLSEREPNEGEGKPTRPYSRRGFVQTPAAATTSHCTLWWGVDSLRHTAIFRAKHTLLSSFTEWFLSLQTHNAFLKNQELRKRNGMERAQDSQGDISALRSISVLSWDLTTGKQ